LPSRASLRIFAGQVTLTTIAQGATTLALVVAQVVLARTVTVPVFGALAAAQAMVALLETAIVGRSGDVALQLIGQYWGRDDGIVRATARSLWRLDVAYCLAAFAGLALFAAVAAQAFSIDGAYVVGLALSLPVQIGYGARRSLFVVADDIRGQAIYEIINSVSLVVLTAGLTLAFGAWGMIAGSVLAAGAKNLLAHLSTRTIWTPAARASPAELPATVKQAMRISSFHSVLRNLLRNAAANADVLLLSLSGRPEAVAIYKVARTLAGVPLRAAAPVWLVLRPRLLESLRDDDHRRFNWIILRMAGLMALATAAAVPLALFLGEPVLRTFYGAAYGAALQPFLILLVGTSVFGAVTGWLAFTLVISSRKTLGSAIFAVQLALILLFGALLGGSAVRMAWVVAGCNVAVSALAWAALLAGAFRHVRDAKLEKEIPAPAE